MSSSLLHCFFHSPLSDQVTYLTSAHAIRTRDLGIESSKSQTPPLIVSPRKMWCLSSTHLLASSLSILPTLTFRYPLYGSSHPGSLINMLVPQIPQCSLAWSSETWNVVKLFFLSSISIRLRGIWANVWNNAPLDFRQESQWQWFPCILPCWEIVSGSALSNSSFVGGRILYEIARHRHPPRMAISDILYRYSLFENPNWTEPSGEVNDQLQCGGSPQAIHRLSLSDVGDMWFELSRIPSCPIAKRKSPHLPFSPHFPDKYFRLAHVSEPLPTR